MTTPPNDNGQWIRPLGDAYVGLDHSAVIRRVLGKIDRPPMHPGSQAMGMTWAQFVETYADPSAYEGLLAGWHAIIEGCVAPPYWPTMLPFAGGMVARIQPVVDDPLISAVVQVRADLAAQANATLDSVTHHVLDRMAQLSHQLIAGTAGPLTDMQVAHTRSIAQNVIYTRQFLEQLRAEVFSLAVAAPTPHSIADMFGFTEHDFVERRIVTHRLHLESRWSSEQVYCLAGLRETVRQLIHALFQHITEETNIQMDDRLSDDGEACQVHLQYHSRDPELRVSEPLTPFTLTNAQQSGSTRHIDRLITAVDTWLRPLNGRVWVEPSPGLEDTAVIVLLLPRWMPMATGL